MRKIKFFLKGISIGNTFIVFSLLNVIVFLFIAFLIINIFYDIRKTTNELIDYVSFEYVLSSTLTDYKQITEFYNTFLEKQDENIKKSILTKINTLKNQYKKLSEKYSFVSFEQLSNNINYIENTLNSSNAIDIDLQQQSLLYEDAIKQIKNIVQMRLENGENRLNRLLINRLYILFTIFILLLFGMLISSIIIKKFLGRDMDALNYQLKYKINENDFKEDIDIKGFFKELSKINYFINEFIIMIRDIIGHLIQNSTEIAAFSEQLAVSTQEVSSATQEVAGSTQNISSDIIILKDNTDKMTMVVNNMNQLMGKTLEYLEKASKVNEEFIKLMSSETEMINDSTDNMSEMEHSISNIKHFIDDFIGQVNNIKTSVDSIKSVHKKIELLSLNAAIEAARAGKEGGGFAVIAEEIRSLSSKSSDASKEIERIMEDVISNIKELHNLISNSLEGFHKIQEDWSKIFEISTKINLESENTFNETYKLNKGIKNMEDKFTELSNMFKEIKIRIDNIVASSEQISSSNEEITSQMEELTSSSQELSDKAQSIKDFVKKFKI